MPNFGALLPKNQVKGILFFIENYRYRPMVKITEKMHFHR